MFTYWLLLVSIYYTIIFIFLQPQMEKEKLFRVYDRNCEELLIEAPSTIEQIKDELGVIYFYEEDFNAEYMRENLETFMKNAELELVPYDWVSNRQKLLDIIENWTYDFNILLENILGSERLTNDMIENVKSWDDDMCKSTIEDLEETDK